MIVILYLSGYLAQLLFNYSLWTSQGNFAGNGTAPGSPSANFFTCLYYVLFKFPYNLQSLFFCVLVLGIIVFMVLRMGNGGNDTYDKERNIIYSDRGSYGTSGFMTDNEFKEVLELHSDISKCNGTILGTIGNKVVSVPVDSKLNRNIAVYGASGSMKSRAFARNMIFQCVKRGESLIITDPKSELYESMSRYCRDHGYVTKCLNLVSLENSDGWNFLKEIEGQELMAQIVTDTIIDNTGSENSDMFWSNSEANLLKALILFVEKGFPEEGKNMAQVYKLISQKSAEALDAIFGQLANDHPAKAPYNIYKQASPTVRSSIIIGLGSRLQVFQNKLIRQVTSYDEIDIELAGRKKCAYFCITSDQDSSLEFISSLFMTFCFIKLVRYADRHGIDGKLPIPTHILADELPNIGCINDLCKKISTIRSRALSMSCLFQNLPQMQNRYPNNQYLEIIGNCDVQYFMGCSDAVTADFISQRTGDVTLSVSSQSKKLNSWRVSDYTPEYRETKSIGRRKLLTMDEVMRLPQNKALVIVRGEKVLMVDKFDFTKHPEAKKLKPSKATEHIPDWNVHIDEDEKDYLEELYPAKPKARGKGRGRKKTPPPAVEQNEDAEDMQYNQISIYESKPEALSGETVQEEKNKADPLLMNKEVRKLNKPGVSKKDIM